MRMSIKKYEFDKLLDSLDIKLIDRNIVSVVYQQVRCDRCNKQKIKYVNILRIELAYFNIGDDCYQSIKNALSEIRGKSLHFIRLDLEESYDHHLIRKHPEQQESFGYVNPKKSDPQYSLYLSMKWDNEHGSLPNFKVKEFKELELKFK